jgi:hypothetical protein
MQTEILKIPEYLDSLEPKDKINTLCKLILEFWNPQFQN